MFQYFDLMFLTNKFKNRFPILAYWLLPHFYMQLPVVLSYRDFCHYSDFSNAMIMSATSMSLQAECELVKIDINCHIQGDVVLECSNLHDDMEREEMILRVMFNTAFIRSNIIMLNRNDVDMMWNAKDQFPKDFRAEVNF